ncbi:RHOMBOID-like protein 5 isoform X1 [Prosopis cineraria]|uniref:RHOMBOID-like protein 5 isoform X1 n=1 Tax=Prosopis cineraria TaxID=364024 RepID=UPI00240F867B|nr:RHOMBOID-like protein 5 isoform X1 [Prosopis cineraria]
MGKSPPSPPSDIETAHGGRKGRPSPPYDVDTVHGGRRSRPSSPLDVETDRGETAHGGHKGRPSPPYDVETAHGGSGGRPSPLSDTETRRGHRKSRSETPQPTPRFSPPLPKPWFPWFVPLIFVVNVALFWYSMYYNDCPAKIDKDRKCLLSEYLGRFSFQPFKENPLLGPSTRTLQKLGALQKELVVEDNEGWRLLTCMFLHAGVIHLIANMFSLLSIGIRLEQEFGFVRIGLLYTLSGFAGSLISMLHLEASAKPTISVGASGALFGLLGAMLSELLTNWTIYENKCAALITLLVISALNLSLGFLPRVDNSAHVGGFTSGFLLGFVLLMRPQYGYVNRKHIPPGYDVKRKSKFTFCQYLLFVVSLIILIVGYAYSLIMLFKK